jgi:DNA topoisomerase-1
MTSLILLESPVKINSFKKYLDNDKFILSATYGHIMDLDENNLSVDLKTFEPLYSVCPNKEKVVKNIGSLLKKVSVVYLAMDNDREGEIISYNNQVYFKLKNSKRLLFNSLTKTDIINAIENPTTINMNIVNSQQARRIIDRFYGYIISKTLPQGCKSCGRVQSNIVKIIIEKENEIKKYFEVSQISYFTIHASLLIENLECNTILKNKESNNTKFDNPELEKINLISISDLTLLNMNEEIIEQQPNDPFMTTTLQQQASINFGFTAKETINIAQKLYENGLITYIRTDSIIISKDAQESIKTHIINNYTEEYYNEKIYVNKNKNTQGAHECIRPTDIELIDIQGNTKEIQLYNLIRKRTIQSQMKPALKQKILINVNISKLDDYILEGKIETLFFNGFLLLDNIKNNDKLVLNNINNIIWNSIISEEDIKKPPERYNEASLIKYLTHLSIVRPATCASSISTPIERNYIKQEDVIGKTINTNIYTLIKNKKLKHKIKEVKIGYEKNKFIPTELGYTMCNFMESNFNILIDKNYTINMEKQLNDIVNGKIDKIEIIKPLYEYINNIINTMNIERPLNNNNIVVGNIDEIPVELIKSKKYGNFVICGNDKINVQELYDENSPTNDDIIKYVKPKITKTIGFINDEKVVLKNGLHGYYCVYKNTNINIDSFYKTTKKITNEKIIEYLEKYKIPKLIGRINNLDVLIKIGNNGHYINYNENNYNVEFMYENNEPSNDELLDYLKSKLEKNTIKKEWIIKKNKYVFKKGQYGYYLEEYKNNEKIRNINIDKFITSKLDSNPIDIVLEQITKKELSSLL